MQPFDHGSGVLSVVEQWWWERFEAFAIDRASRPLILRGVVEDAPQPAPTPADAPDQRLARALIGYRRQDVDQLLSELKGAVRAVGAEKAELAERIERLEADLARHRELAPLLQSTLISAERAADTIRQRASTETDQLLDDAHAKARRLTATARAERERLIRETHRLLGSLQTALLILETAPTEADSSHTESEEPAPDLLVDTLHEQIRRLSH